MSEDMESKGIIFDLKWKTKSGGSEFASIGIWEVDDSSLDWFNFKPYLCQTLGNVADVTVSYVDSDGDVIPIDSDPEFQEALKFARRKATVGQKIILMVENVEVQSTASGGMELPANPIYLKSSNFIRERLRLNSIGDNQGLLRFPPAEGLIRTGTSSKVKTKGKNKEIPCPLQSYDSPPLWFKKYMQKMKNEIICEVTENVNNQVKKLLEDKSPRAQPIFIPTGPFKMRASPEASAQSSAWLVTKKNKKGLNEDSSDGAHKVEIKDSKILKKIEKLHIRETKLDYKKEKLEQTAKRIAEMKKRKEREYFSKLRLEIGGCKMPHSRSGSYKPKEPEKHIDVKPKIPSPVEFGNILLPNEMGMTLMGVTIRNDDQCIMPVRRGSNFTKVWKVTNSGSAPWTDETEVRLSWGNAGMIPKVVAVKCPHLTPGEEGEIAISFLSPDYPGIFESHWHFYDKNVRFGSRMSCIISVHLITNTEEVKKSEPPKQCSIPSSSFVEFFVVPPVPISSSDNEDIAVDVVVDRPGSHTERMASVSQSIQPKVDLCSSIPLPWIDDKTVGKQDKCELVAEKEAELESISTDDLSGSVGSVEYEYDDNFVVIPMPPCFRFDVPLEAGGYAIKAESSGLQEQKEMPNTLKKEESQSPNQPQSSTSPESKTTQTSNYPDLSDLALQSEVSHDTGEVISMPISPPQLKPATESPPSQSAVTQMPPNQSFQCVKPRGSTVESDESSSCSYVLRSTSTSPSRNSDSAGASSLGPKQCATTTTESDQSPNSSAAAAAAEAASSGAQKIPEKGGDKGDEGKSTNIPQAQGTPRAKSTSPPRGSRPINLSTHGVSEVISGAVNVTNSALSAAFAALDSILVKTSGSSVHPLPTAPSPTMQQPPVGPQQGRTHLGNIDPLIAENITKLVSMGFVNIDLNKALLHLYSNNITDVIDALLNGEM